MFWLQLYAFMPPHTTCATLLLPTDGLLSDRRAYLLPNLLILLRHHFYSPDLRFTIPPHFASSANKLPNDF